MIQTPVIADWSAGELSPKMFGRNAHPMYQRGAQVLTNFHVTDQAIITKRAGFKRVAPANATTQPARVIPYVNSDTESYVIEISGEDAAGDGNIRVFRNGLVVTSTSSPTYLRGELFEIHYTQDNNGIYFFHKNHPPKSLIRETTDTFTWADIVFISPLGVTYTSHDTSNPVDANAMVVQETIGTTVPQQGFFSVEHAPGESDRYSYTEHNTLKAFKGVSPVLARAYDDDDNVIIGHKFHSDGNKTPFGAANDYPRTASIIGGRFYFAGALGDPQRVWASEVWGYEVQSNVLYVRLLYLQTIATTAEIMKASDDWAKPGEPETESITAMRESIPADKALDFVIGSDRGDHIMSLTAGPYLLIQTQSSEWVAPAVQRAYGPSVQMHSRYGSSDLQGLLVGESLVFVQNDRRTVREYHFSESRGQYESESLSRFSDHIFDDSTTGVADVAYQSRPYSVLYFVGSNGDLVVLTYERMAGVIAWQRFRHSYGAVTSAAVVPEGGRDVLYIVQKDGDNYFIERQHLTFPKTQADCVFLDGAYDVTADDNPAGALKSGTNITCDWLAGKTVTIMVDGVNDGTEVADGSGVISLIGHSGTQVWLGVDYQADFRSMASSAQGRAGSGQNLLKRVNNLFIRVYRTLDLEAGFDTFATASTVPYVFGATWEDGVKELAFSGEFDREAHVSIISARGYPCTITSITPQTEINE